MTNNSLARAVRHCQSLYRYIEIICYLIGRNADYEQYLCSLFTTADKRPFEWTLGAFNIETSRIKRLSANQSILQGRIAFWRDALDTFNINLATEDNPVVMAIRHYIRRDPLIAPRLNQILDARVLSYFS